MADLISLKCNVDGAVAQIRALQEDQLPFILARSLTAVAQEAQKAVQITEGQVFRLRNDWTVKGTKITPAKVNNLGRMRAFSEVYTDTSNRQTGAPDYLALQEEGGSKQHYGTTYFAIPTKYLRAIQPRTIPAPMRPYNLLPVDAQVGQVYPGRLELIVAGGPKPQFARVSARKLKKLGSVKYVAFKQFDKRGTLCIFVRIDGKRDAEPWYILTPKADVKAVLKMYSTVQEVVDGEFERIFVNVAQEVGVSLKL